MKNEKLTRTRRTMKIIKKWYKREISIKDFGYKSIDQYNIKKIPFEKAPLAYYLKPNVKALKIMLKEWEF